MEQTGENMKISLTMEDLLKGQLHVAGWFKGEISWAAPKQSKDKQSMNYEYGIVYQTGINRPGEETREIKSMFNSKAIGFMKPFLAALSGLSLKDFEAKAIEQAKLGKNVDLDWDDTLKGKKLQIKIENKPREDNGQLASKVTDFAPFDYKTPF